jgi:hypothetical protein
MTPLNQDDLYQNLRGFLKIKGIELQEGSYARGIQKSCSLLTEAINLGQKGLDRAKVGIDAKLDQMRQVIHEKTAPRRESRPSKGSATKTAEPTAARSPRKKSKARKSS